MDYVNIMISHFRKMDDELLKTDRVLLDLVKELFDENENHDIVVEYDDSMKDGYFLVQTFYFKDEEQ